VIVTGQNEIGIVVVQGIPKRQAILVGTSARTKQRNMPVSQCTKVRMSGEVRLEPFTLRRIEVAAAGIPAIGVKCNQMPRSNVVTVITCTLSAGCRSIILEVSSRSCIGWVTTGTA